MANHSSRAHAHHARTHADHGHPAGEGTGTDADTDEALAELLDLSAEVLQAHLAEVTGWVAELAGGRPPRRLLDLGSGTGSGTFALLRRFPGAHATAVDSSPFMLHRLRDRARALGTADRVHTVQADLDEAWPAVGTIDLVWASASLHHLADPDRVLAEVHSALRPGGLLAVTEMDSPLPRFLPDGAGPGAAGLEARCHAALAEAQAHHMPLLGSDWGSRLTGAGFTVRAERLFTIHLTPPLPAAAGRYAQATLNRVRSFLQDRLSADDLAALDALTDGERPDGVLHRTDLTVRTSRTVWVATRS